MKMKNIKYKYYRILAYAIIKRKVIRLRLQLYHFAWIFLYLFRFPLHLYLTKTKFKEISMQLSTMLELSCRIYILARIFLEAGIMFLSQLSPII